MTTLTPRQLIIIRALKRYHYLTAAQCHGLIEHAEKKAGWDADRSVTREILRGMLSRNWVRRHTPSPPGNASVKAAPVYGLTIRGSAELARHHGDTSYFVQADVSFRDWLSLHHHLGVSDLAIAFDRALAAQSHVMLHALRFEHEVVCPGAEKPSEKYALYAEWDQGKLKCCPDAGCEIEVGGHRRVLFWEYETGSDGSPARVVAKKHKGYARLAAEGTAEGKGFRRRFPNARDMRVLCVCPYRSFMDGMRAELKGGFGRPAPAGAELWLFALTEELRPETILFEPVVYKVDSGPIPLIPPPKGYVSPATSPGAGGSNGGSGGAGAGGGASAQTVKG